MRKARTIALLGAVLGLVGPVASAGVAGEPNPNWFNDPVEGPSPNPTHEVGNEEGGECRQAVVNPFGPGPRTLGGDLRFFVSVRLRNQADTMTIFEDFFLANEIGDWGGPFPIPAGLDPGLYPLKASCIMERVDGGLEPTTVFEYEDRSYTVVAERERARPVVRVVTFTG